jgi:DNA methylase
MSGWTPPVRRVAAAPEQLFGLDLFGEPVRPASPRGPLATEFVCPPFSVLNARDGAWQERKRAWLSLGLRGEEGRENGQGKDNEAIPGGATGANSAWKLRGANGYRSVRESQDAGEEPSGNGTSIFDPVLCELMYRWFCPPGGLVLDPFAGGSVRGIVASLLGRRYVGIDLSAQQITANLAQAYTICDEPAPVWIVGDSRELPTLWPESEPVDMVFSCPPYANLERYSEDPRDLSTLEYPEFVAGYFDILTKALAWLKDDRFACMVVGEVRHPTGRYLGFVNDTVTAMQLSGLEFYNDAILVTAVGSLPVRVPIQFRSGRKLGKTHQNVLVFVKGDWRRAAAACQAVAAHDEKS